MFSFTYRKGKILRSLGRGIFQNNGGYGGHEQDVVLLHENEKENLRRYCQPVPGADGGVFTEIILRCL